MNQIRPVAPVAHSVFRRGGLLTRPFFLRLALGRKHGATPKPIRPANDWHEDDLLLHLEQVAKRLNTRPAR